MDYQKFSKGSFEALSEPKERIQKLVELDKAITAELQQIVESKMTEIVKNLNQQGHSLTRNAEIEEAGETDFCESHGADTCGFRVGSDITISSGYFGVSDADAWPDDT